MNLYFEATRCLDQLDARKGSIKGVLSTFPEKDRKRGSALVIETLKYKPALQEIMEKSGMLKAEKKHLTSSNLALLLVHDLLFARGIQAGDGPIKQAVLRHKTRLQSELVRLKIARSVKSNQDLAVTQDPKLDGIPRYVRVNTCRWNTKAAIKYFESKGFMHKPLGFPEEKTFSQDPHIPDLLLFHPSVQFHTESAYTSGQIILQDKASCMPAVVLAPPKSQKSYVIDATAAPGNKTSHLSALMGNVGKIFAFERDRRRFNTLQKMLATAGCSNVEALNADFLASDPESTVFAQVTHILLDPSCSGSGIVNRMDHLLGQAEENDQDVTERLATLSAFQLSMIEHAMKFPNAQKIVYSTCSIHAEENEQVVKKALDSEHARSAGFQLASRDQVLPSWERRGQETELGTQFREWIQSPLYCVSTSSWPGSVIRCNPGEDATNGFFVSCFVRQSNPATSIQTKLPDTTHTVMAESQPQITHSKRKAEDSREKQRTKRKKRKQ
ncbi:S-adenosyl-L-methionine-dependent methyltransferase [Sistotremastrum niveocremeum HHB9708]|uniref:S-adenosyl-L-methionine-dependent methyltransferase n=2 Tax=Sistotremastraceae TaxID=3402574 RepID=A0A164TNB7_9AGAM|nr:S-adenosyl-L-methionine-dependent methyltransferase [Sistotremastrum niveocremeum HHB9708]KZT42175.1 S-adenosyl-L-methionine-dependent methyltransferase [Sistotremastrum suecicum HHB10207 ss-3]